MSSNLDALTRVVYGEIRGESDEGKKAHAWAVINGSKKTGQNNHDIFQNFFTTLNLYYRSNHKFIIL